MRELRTLPRGNASGHGRIRIAPRARSMNRRLQSAEQPDPAAHRNARPEILALRSGLIGMSERIREDDRRGLECPHAARDDTPQHDGAEYGLMGVELPAAGKNAARECLRRTAIECADARRDRAPVGRVGTSSTTCSCVPTRPTGARSRRALAHSIAVRRRHSRAAFFPVSGSLKTHQPILGAVVLGGVVASGVWALKSSPNPSSRIRSDIPIRPERSARISGRALPWAAGSGCSALWRPRFMLRARGGDPYPPVAAGVPARKSAELPHSVPYGWFRADWSAGGCGAQLFDSLSGGSAAIRGGRSPAPIRSFPVRWQ